MPKYLGTSNDDKDLVTKGYVETKIQGIVESLTNYVLNSKLASYVLKTDLVDYSKTNHRHNNATATGDGFLSKEDKTKLDTVENNANNYVHPNSHPYSMITGTPTSLPANGGNADTVNNKTVEANVPSNAKFTDTITTVNGKTGAVTKADIVALGIPGQDTNTTYSNATTTNSGLMSNTDKVKLDGVEANANNYVHPSTHPASIISETSTKRFVSDAEKNTWNNKQNNLGFVPENSTNKGKVNGYASLDANGKVPASELPSYVDDVLEATTLANLPITGETGKIYVTTNDNKTYRWSGTAYTEISASLALGTTSSTAYRGDLGNIAYSHSQATGNPHGTTKAQIGLGNVDNTSDANKPVSTAMQTELDKKVNNSQVLTDVPANAKFTDTIYSHPSTHPASMIVETSTKRFTTDVEKANWNSKTDDSTVDSHIAKTDNPHNVTKAQVGLSNVDNTDDLSKPISTDTQDALDLKADKSQVLTNVPANAKFTDTVYSHPSSHPASMITESTTKRFVSDTEKTTWNNKTDDSTVDAHIAKIDNPHNVTKSQVGLGNVDNVKQASKIEFDAHVGDATHVTTAEKNKWNAKQDTIIAGTNLTKSGNTLNAIDTKYDNATTLVSGLMSDTDKSKLDSIESGANNYVHPSSHPASMITESTTKRFVTDTEKSTWNAKQNALVAGSNVTISGNTISATNTNTTYGVVTTTTNGLMAATDKVKLNGIAANANNYTHPSSHPASIITQDANNRFVTDTEKSTWNAKQDTIIAGSNITKTGNTISAKDTTYGVATTTSNGLMSASDKIKLDGLSTGTGSEGSSNTFLNGIKWSILGDSITRGYGTDKTYHSYISDNYSITINNYGVDGSEISSGGTKPSPFIGRYSNITSDSDVITIFGGVNDFFHNVQMGNFSSRDNNTFYGALHNLIYGIKSSYPKSKLGFITPLQTAYFDISGTSLNGVGKTLINYVDAIKEVCLFYDVPVLDLHNAKVIDPFVTEERTNFMPDGLHPNSNGHNKISKSIEYFLKYLVGEGKYIYSSNSDAHSLLSMIKKLSSRIDLLENNGQVEYGDSILTPSSVKPFNATDIQINGVRKQVQTVEDLSIPLELFQWDNLAGASVFANDLKINNDYTLVFEYEPQDSNMKGIAIETNTNFAISNVYVDGSLVASDTSGNINADKFPIGVKQKNKVVYQFNTGSSAINGSHFIRILMNPAGFTSSNKLFVTNLAIYEGHVGP